MASGSEEDPLALSELLSNTVPISQRLPDRLIFLNSCFMGYDNSSIPFSKDAWIKVLLLLQRPYIKIHNIVMFLSNISLFYCTLVLVS